MRFAVFFLAFGAAALLAAGTPPAEPIRNTATETKSLNPKLPTGGLPPAVGIQNFQVFRATRATANDISPEQNWTYNHHMDLAQWHGRMYLAWTNGQKDEDVWPSHELYITTEDGITWSKPAELFPQGVSTSLRTYFFHAPNGRMLTLAGLRTNTEKLNEAKKGGAVVREIRADHTLGPVYTLIDPPAPEKPMTPMPKFDTAPDAPFVGACRQLLANHTFLEQQDYGTLLGKNRMAVHEGANADFGKAMSFYHRPDGTLVGIGKRAWTTISTDEGQTWSVPVRLSTLDTGMAKEWVQRTSDGRYAMIYDAHASNRYPMVVVTSDDGITFKDMRLIHGEVPLQRYEGAGRSVGPQYVRGISEWARDDTAIKRPGAKDMWIVYSSSKEDIWVSRIPVPLKIAETAAVHDRFTTPGNLIAGWNTYSPRWAPVAIAAAPDGTNALTLTDRDPYDYAQAQRIFPETASASVHFKFLVQETPAQVRLDIELAAPFGDERPVRLTLANGKLTAINGLSGASVNIGAMSADKWNDLTIEAHADTNTFSVTLNGGTPFTLTLAEKTTTFHRLTLRTGAYRAILTGADAQRVDPATDKPTEPAIFFVKDVDITP